MCYASSSAESLRYCGCCESASASPYSSWRAKASGKVASTPKADSWRFSDGKAVEFYEYFDTAQVVQAMTPA